MFALIQDNCQFFRRVTRQGKAVGPERLNDKEVARLVKRLRWRPAFAVISVRLSAL
jgi:hypothetical protein